MKSFKKLAYQSLPQKFLPPVDEIKVGLDYSVINYDGKTLFDLGKCLKNQYIPWMFGGHFTEVREENRILQFENDDYPTKNDIIEMIGKDYKNAKIPIILSETQRPLPSTEQELLPPPPREQELLPPPPPTRETKLLLLKAVKGYYPENVVTDDSIIAAYANSVSKDEFLKKNILNVNKYSIVNVLFNSNGTKILFGGHKRKSHRRKSHRRKSHKRKVK
jgi:hypothetical protein